MICPYCNTEFNEADLFVRFERTLEGGDRPPARAGGIVCSRETGRPVQPVQVLHYCERGVAKEIPA